MAVAVSHKLNFIERFRKAHKKRNAHEKSVILRAIAFGTQVTGIISLAVTAQVWLVALISVVILLGGHWSSYRSVLSKPSKWINTAAFIGLHLALCWMLTGIFIGQPYPQAQFAMLGMAIISWALYSRINLFSAMGLGLINLYVAATLSRTYGFGIFLLMFALLVLAFLWIADSQDGLRKSTVTFKKDEKSTT